MQRLWIRRLSRQYLKTNITQQCYYKAKRDEFLKLSKKSFLLAKYKRKYTALLQYLKPIIPSKEERCRRCETRLRKEICTLVSAIAKWTNVSQLIETDLWVEQSLSEEREEFEERKDDESKDKQHQSNFKSQKSTKKDFQTRPKGRSYKPKSLGRVCQKKNQGFKIQMEDHHYLNQNPQFILTKEHIVQNGILCRISEIPLRILSKDYKCMLLLSTTRKLFERMFKTSYKTTGAKECVTTNKQKVDTKQKGVKKDQLTLNKKLKLILQNKVVIT